ncbi:MAG TPA: aromatic ring-hydroxylating dioxygenase subunit alpha [Steroidobacteraceae bacterium]|nr:aromatic ring-hydroxylating dioxygenase subunit alpha [Steroidobacteraceae bacterium]
MTNYRENPGALRALVREDAVHRDVYVDPTVFDLEMERLWRRTWLYVGHDSQVPATGDYFTTTLAREPVIMLRDQGGEIRVLMNRCAHKGARLVTAAHGSCEAGLLRCPYHGWTYRLDGSLRTVPLPGGYAGTALEQSPAGRGIARLPQVVNYRGFIFARLCADGPDFHDYFGGSLSSIDNMVERAPEGRLEVAGGVLRYLHDANWKMFVENLNDTMHPMVAHQSAAGTAKKLWADQADDVPKPMAIEQFLPFVNGYDFFDRMGVRIFPNGHSYTGVNFSIHSNYAAIGEYERRMASVYGEARARAILGEVRHNTVYYPSLTIKGAIQAIRVVRPIAVDRTLIESWTFRLVGAPDRLLQRTLLYTRLINAPTSVVGHDDRHCYRAIQEGLAAGGNDWVSLHRNHTPAERESIAGDYNGTSEVSMRGQFRAWAQFIGESDPDRSKQ